MKKQPYFRLLLVFTTMVVVVMAFNFGYDPGLGWFSYAQEIDQVKEQIFNEAKEALQRARDEGAPLLSPNNFAKANEFYLKALEDYEKGERLKKIRENLERTMEHIDAAFESAKLSRIVLERMLRLREETLNLEFLNYHSGITRPGYFKDKFLTEKDFLDEQSYNIPEAEQKFREAAMKIEDGDVKSAKSIAREAEEEYRWSLIEALKRIVLADARNKLKDAKDTIPKESFRRAKAELDEMEDFIKAQKDAEFAIGELVKKVNDRIQQALAITTVEVKAAELPDLVIEEEMTNEQLKQKVVAAAENIETYQFDVDATMNISGKRRYETIDRGIPLNGNGAVDIANKKMKQTRVVGGPNGMEVEECFIHNMRYAKVIAPRKAAQWTKRKMPEGYWELQNQLDLALDLLKRSEIEIVSEVKVSGIDCYLVKVISSKEKLWRMLAGQPGIGEQAMGEGLNLSEAITDISYRQWFARDTHFLMKYQLRMTMLMTPNTIDIFEEEEFDLTENMNFTVMFHKFNEPVSIELPPEAENAFEVGPIK